MLFVNETHFKISWDLPESDGGCPIIGYAIWSDLGVIGLIDKPIIAIADADDPFMFEYLA